MKKLVIVVSSLMFLLGLMSLVSAASVTGVGSNATYYTSTGPNVGTPISAGGVHVLRNASYKIEFVLTNGETATNVTTINITLPSTLAFVGQSNSSNISVPEIFSNSTASNVATLSWNTSVGGEPLLNSTFLDLKIAFNVTISTSAANDGPLTFTIVALNETGSVVSSATVVGNFSLDNSAPTLTSTGSLIARNKINVSFSEEMNSANFDAGDFNVTDSNGNNVEVSSVTKDITSTNKTFNLTLAVSIASNETLTVIVNTTGVTDIANNTLVQFSSAAISDKVAPNLVSVNYSHDGGKIMIAWDEPVLPTTLNATKILIFTNKTGQTGAFVLSTIDVVSSNVSDGANYTNITLNAVGKKLISELNVSGNYVLMLNVTSGAVVDMQGNSNNATTNNTFSSYQNDTTLPVLQNVTYSESTRQLVLFFDDYIQPTKTVVANISVSNVSNQTNATIGAYVNLTAAATTIGAGTKTNITLTLTENFAANISKWSLGKLYIAYHNGTFRNADSAVVGDTTSSARAHENGRISDAFTSETTVPYVVNISIDDTSPAKAGVKTVVLQYSEYMDTSLNNTFRLVNSGTASAWSYSWLNSTLLTLSINVTVTSPGEGTATARITGGKDIAGNSELTNNSLFTTEIDTREPTIEFVYYEEIGGTPWDGIKEVGGRIVIVMSENMTWVTKGDEAIALTNFTFVGGSLGADATDTVNVTVQDNKIYLTTRTVPTLSLRGISTINISAANPPHTNVTNITDDAGNPMIAPSAITGTNGMLQLYIADAGFVVVSNTTHTKSFPYCLNDTREENFITNQSISGTFQANAGSSGVFSTVSTANLRPLRGHRTTLTRGTENNLTFAVYMAGVSSCLDEGIPTVSVTNSYNLLSIDGINRTGTGDVDGADLWLQSLNTGANNTVTTVSHIVDTNGSTVWYRSRTPNWDTLNIHPYSGYWVFNVEAKTFSGYGRI